MTPSPGRHDGLSTAWARPPRIRLLACLPARQQRLAPGPRSLPVSLPPHGGCCLSYVRSWHASPTGADSSRPVLPAGRAPCRQRSTSTPTRWCWSLDTLAPCCTSCDAPRRSASLRCAAGRPAPRLATSGARGMAGSAVFEPACGAAGRGVLCVARQRTLAGGEHAAQLCILLACAAVTPRQTDRRLPAVLGACTRRRHPARQCQPTAAVCLPHTLPTPLFCWSTPSSVGPQVVVAEASPTYQGQQMATELAAAGIHATLIPDSAIFAMMARVNKARPAPAR